MATKSAVGTRVLLMTRIIAGRAKGVRLATPDSQRTRPTVDRVREALFRGLVSWAGTTDEAADTQLSGIAFLDLFAGSGAVGLEAASRGAAPVTLVEKDRATAELIRRNAGHARLDVEVVTAGVDSYLARGVQRVWDVVWADPPYDLPSGQLVAELATLLAAGGLAADGLVVVERRTRDPEPAWPAELTETWSRRYGETTLYYCRPGTAGEDDR